MHYWKPLKTKLTNPVTIKFSILLNKNISTNQKPGLLQNTIGVNGITLGFFKFFHFLAANTRISLTSSGMNPTTYLLYSTLIVFHFICRNTAKSSLSAVLILVWFWGEVVILFCSLIKDSTKILHLDRGFKTLKTTGLALYREKFGKRILSSTS